MAAGVFVTRDAWADIVHLARVDAEQSHVFLVPFVAGWLFWVRRERLRRYAPSVHWAGPLTVAAGWALNRAGEAWNLQSLWHLGAVLVVVGGLLSVVGGGFLVRFLPAFVSLCFLVPVPGVLREAVAIPLQSATAHLTQGALETLGVDVERVGSVLRINNQEVMIAEACNGMRMVFALVLVSFVFAYGVPLRTWIRVVVILGSPVTALAFNVARLVPTVWAFGSFPSDVAASLHDASGWIMLPCAFLTLLGLMRLLRWAQIPITPYILAYGT